MNTCPRCGDGLVAGQAYCVECGLRLPGPDVVGATRDPGRGWVRRSLVGLAVAAAGAVLAVVASGGTGGGSTILTATGGFATTPAGVVPAPTGGRGKIVDWPAGQQGWTITLASLPQTGGRRAAVLRARQAKRRGLERVGILDSSHYASLHPGYWVVFTGVYASQADASSALQTAHAFAKTAAVRRIVP